MITIAVPYLSDQGSFLQIYIIVYNYNISTYILNNGLLIQRRTSCLYMLTNCYTVYKKSKSKYKYKSKSKSKEENKWTQKKMQEN